MIDRCAYCHAAAIAEIESFGGMLTLICERPECVEEAAGDVEQDEAREARREDERP
jgi:hypothetical protein